MKVLYGALWYILHLSIPLVLSYQTSTTAPSSLSTSVPVTLATEQIYYYDDDWPEGTGEAENMTATPEVVLSPASIATTATAVTTSAADIAEDIKKSVRTFRRLKEDSTGTEIAEEKPRIIGKKQLQKHEGAGTTIVIVVTGLLALATTTALALASVLYCRRRATRKKKQTDPRWSFYATETEPRAWDSLSFSQSTTDLSNNKFQLQSWESLSDDSYINSLDEVISQRASIMKANSKRNLNVSSKLQLSQASRVSVAPDPTSNSSH